MSTELRERLPSVVSFCRNDTMSRAESWATTDGRSIRDLRIFLAPKAGAPTQGPYCAAGYDIAHYGHWEQDVFFDLDEHGRSEYYRLRSLDHDLETFQAVITSLGKSRPGQAIAYGSVNFEPPQRDARASSFISVPEPNTEDVVEMGLVNSMQSIQLFDTEVPNSDVNDAQERQAGDKMEL